MKFGELPESLKDIAFRDIIFHKEAEYNKVVITFKCPCGSKSTLECYTTSAKQNYYMITAFPICPKCGKKLLDCSEVII